MSEASISILVGSEDEIDIEFYAYPDKKEKGRILVSDKRPLGIKSQHLRFIFRRPTNKDLIQIRRGCTTYQQQYGVYHTDPDVQNENRIRRFLKSWNLDEVMDEETLQVQTGSGKVTDQTWKTIISLDTVIFQHLVYRLNRRIEI